MDQANISSETKGAVRVLRMWRPEKKNALTQEMYRRLTAGLDEAQKDDTVRAVLLTGAPGVFTAGNDLGDFLSAPPTGGDSPVLRFLARLAAFEKPLVAAVDGPAVGIGTTLLLHCDLVVATTQVRFQLPFVQLGLVPEAGSSLLLPRLAGLQRASEWLLLGNPFSAVEAETAGLVNRVVQPAELEGAAMALAEQLASRPPEAVRLSKKLIRAPLQSRLAEAMRSEEAVFIERLGSDEARAAISALLQRRR